MTLNWEDLSPEDLASLVGDDDPQDFRPGAHRHTATASQAVAVLVDDIGAGVWARYTGTLADGTPVTVSGACVGGPDPHGDVFAVAVRTYRPGEPDLVVYIGAGEPVWLVDDVADHEARAAHGLAPVFGPVVKAIEVEWVGTSRKHGRWRDRPPVHHPTSEQMAALERGGPDVMLSAVYRGHLSIDKG